MLKGAYTSLAHKRPSISRAMAKEPTRKIWAVKMVWVAQWAFIENDT